VLRAVACTGGVAGVETLLDDMVVADADWRKLAAVPGLLEPWNDVRDKWQVATDEFKVIEVQPCLNRLEGLSGGMRHSNRSFHQTVVTPADSWSSRTYSAAWRLHLVVDIPPVHSGSLPDACSQQLCAGSANECCRRPQLQKASSCMYADVYDTGSAKLTLACPVSMTALQTVSELSSHYCIIEAAQPACSMPPPHSSLMALTAVCCQSYSKSNVYES
jgi:hypothetical protein